ncbi:MAG: hypothetical protein FGM24_03950 [Candidatus Kapabacteria bacterium]|nr:hypothetical protein [Candidatus Kapabacteria bacterium]
MEPALIDVSGHLRSGDTGETYSCTTADGSVRLTVAREWQQDCRSAAEHGMAVWIGGASNSPDGSIAVLPTSLVVLDPVSLYDVTEVSSLIDDVGLVPAIALIRRLTPPAFSTAAARGKLINTMLDILVAEPGIADAELLRQAERQHPLMLAQLEERNEYSAVIASAKTFIPLLKRGLAELPTGTYAVEPTFASPQLGLIGRIDLLIRDAGNDASITVVELKAGSAPSSGTPRSSHQAQVVAYDMLLDQVEPARAGASFVWYPAATTSQLRPVSTAPVDRQMVIRARNQLVRLEHMISERHTELLTGIANEDGAMLPRFMHDDFRNLKADLEALGLAERTYLRAWMSFIAREQQQQRQEVATPMWSNSLVERQTRPSAVTDLRVQPDQVDRERGYIGFERLRPNDDCSLRKGDIVIAYPIDTADAAQPWRRQLLKATVRSIQHDSLEISLRNKHTSIDTILTSVAASTRWIVEADATEGSLRDLYGNLGMWLRSDPAMRQLLMGGRRPWIGPPKDVSDASLRASQRDVVSRALGTQDWFLIQGPPGTGKTSAVIRALTAALRTNPDERVLLLAYTNRAADEICTVIEAQHGAEAYIRIGSKEAIGNRRSVHALGAAMEARALRDLIASTRCVVATIAAMTRNIDVFAHGGFSTTIVDEASQVVDPQIIGLLARSGRFILVGDECQLPAVIMQPADRLTVASNHLTPVCMHSLGTSYFARLVDCAVTHGWENAIGRLTEQGRMHTRIGSVASNLWYGGSLTTMLPWQESTEPWLTSDDAELNTIVRERIVAMHVPASAPAERSEARLAAAMAMKMYTESRAAGIDASVGIITPFRTQINAIRAALDPALRDYITVDTVERYQGSERDVIIYSTAVTSATEVDALTSEATTVYGTIDRKLNVAVTRAKHQFILIGDTDILKASRHYERLLEHCTPISTSNLVL